MMELTRGKILKAHKVVLYGPEGIGKSTFASHFPDPAFIDTEGSTNNMDVKRFPAPTSWTMLMNEAEETLKNPSLCKTLVIDTADWAERLCIEQTCAKLKISGIEDLGYGKGYVYLSEEFGKLLNLLEEITRKGVNTVLTAHAAMRKFEQPDELGAYDRWELKLSKKTAPLVKEWADMLLFANYLTHVTLTKDNKRKASGGERVMYATHHACWDAKNRCNLPDMLPFDYTFIAPVIEPLSDNSAPAQMRSTEEAPTIPDATMPEKATQVSSAQDAASTRDIPAADARQAGGEEAIDYSGCPQALIDLMKKDRVSPFELRAAVASKGYYPMSASISVYDPSFVQGCLIGAWAQVLKIILDSREKEPF